MIQYNNYYIRKQFYRLVLNIGRLNQNHRSKYSDQNKI